MTAAQCRNRSIPSFDGITFNGLVAYKSSHSTKQRQITKFRPLQEIKLSCAMFRTSSSVIRRSLNLAASSTRSVGVKTPVNSFKLNRSAINQISIRWSSTDTAGDVKEPKVAEQVVDDLGDVIPNVITDADKILGLEKEIRDLKDRVVRSLAEEENVRHIISFPAG